MLILVDPSGKAIWTFKKCSYKEFSDLLFAGGYCCLGGLFFVESKIEWASLSTFWYFDFCIETKSFLLSVKCFEKLVMFIIYNCFGAY